MCYRDEETLRNLYIDKRLDQEEIAQEFDVSQATISRWIRKYNIKRPLKDRDYLEQLYQDQEMSCREIADKLGVWQGSVGKALNRHGIETRKSNREKVPKLRTNSYGHEYFPIYVDGKRHSVYHHRLLAAVEHDIGTFKDKDVHHTNGIPWDNRSDNLEVVSREEHNKLHLPEKDDKGRFVRSRSTVDRSR